MNKMKDMYGIEFTPTHMDRLITLLNASGLTAFYHTQPCWDDTIQVIFTDKDGNRIGDAVCHCSSYGHQLGLLEIMGLDITEEEYGDEVLGFLTAEEVLIHLIKTLQDKGCI